MKVLVVDDEDFHREIVRHVVSDLGHEAIEAANGDEAFEALKGLDAGIIVSDWMMPGTDGLALCDRVRMRENSEYIYFILTSGRATSKQEYREAMVRGVDDFLTKPLDREALSIRLQVAERIITLSRRVYQLERLVPICMYCKDIKISDKLYQPLELYLSDHSPAKFTHGICPNCLRQHFPNSPR